MPTLNAFDGTVFVTPANFKYLSDEAARYRSYFCFKNQESQTSDIIRVGTSVFIRVRRKNKYHFLSVYELLEWVTKTTTTLPRALITILNADLVIFRKEHTPNLFSTRCNNYVIYFSFFKLYDFLDRAFSLEVFCHSFTRQVCNHRF